MGSSGTQKTFLKGSETSSDKNDKEHRTASGVLTQGNINLCWHGELGNQRRTQFTVATGEHLSANSVV